MKIVINIKIFVYFWDCFEKILNDLTNTYNQVYILYYSANHHLHLSFIQRIYSYFGQILIHICLQFIQFFISQFIIFWNMHVEGIEWQLVVSVDLPVTSIQLNLSPIVVLLVWFPLNLYFNIVANLNWYLLPIDIHWAIITYLEFP